MLVRENAQCRETKKIDWMHMTTGMKMSEHLSVIFYMEYMRSNEQDNI